MNALVVGLLLAIGMGTDVQNKVTPPQSQTTIVVEPNSFHDTYFTELRKVNAMYDDLGIHLVQMLQLQALRLVCTMSTRTLEATLL